MTRSPGSWFPRAWLLPLLGLLGVSALAESDAGEQGPWEFSGTVEGITIKTRVVEGTRVRQVLAEATSEGSVAEFRDVLTDVPAFPGFMPYVKEARILEQESPSAVRVYLRLELPWPVSNRDYATRRITDAEPDASGGGEFKIHWSAIPDGAPLRKNTIRVARNDGYWHVSPKPDGRVLLEHGFIVDPGGNLPMVTVNYGNKKGVPDMFRAVIGEVRRRRAARSHQPSAAEPPQPVPQP